MAMPPFIGVQIGALVSLPLAADPLVAVAVTTLHEPKPKPKKKSRKPRKKRK